MFETVGNVVLNMLFFATIILSFVPLIRKAKKVEGFPYYLLYVFCFLLIIAVIMITMILMNPATEHVYNEIMVLFVNFQLINLLLRGFIYGFYILKKEKYYLGFMFYMMLVFLVIPDFVFGLIYNMWDNLYQGEHMNPSQSIYFSFATHYSLSLTEEPFVSVIKNINTHTYFKYLQFEHVIIDRITEIIVIGLISSKIINSFNFVMKDVDVSQVPKKIRRVRKKSRASIYDR